MEIFVCHEPAVMKDHDELSCFNSSMMTMDSELGTAGSTAVIFMMNSWEQSEGAVWVKPSSFDLESTARNSQERSGTTRDRQSGTTREGQPGTAMHLPTLHTIFSVFCLCLSFSSPVLLRVVFCLCFYCV